MTRLALSTLRAHWASFLGAFVTIAAAVGLITACGLMLVPGSGRESLPNASLASTSSFTVINVFAATAPTPNRCQ